MEVEEWSIRWLEEPVANEEAREPPVERRVVDDADPRHSRRAKPMHKGALELSLDVVEHEHTKGPLLLPSFLESFTIDRFIAEIEQREHNTRSEVFDNVHQPPAHLQPQVLEYQLIPTIENFRERLSIVLKRLSSRFVNCKPLSVWAEFWVCLGKVFFQVCQRGSAANGEGAHVFVRA